MPSFESGSRLADVLANLANAYGVEAAILLTEKYDSNTIQSLISAWNYMQKPDDDKISEYLLKCVKKEREINPDQYLIDMGYDPDIFRDRVANT